MTHSLIGPKSKVPRFTRGAPSIRVTHLRLEDALITGARIMFFQENETVSTLGTNLKIASQRRVPRIPPKEIAAREICS